MTDGLNDDELRRIFEHTAPSGSVSMLRPLEVFLPRTWLMELCRDSLRRMKETREPSAETALQQKAAQRALQQRIDFLAWLQRQDYDEIYMALYPVAEDGLEDDWDDLFTDLPHPF